MAILSATLLPALLTLAQDPGLPTVVTGAPEHVWRHPAQRARELLELDLWEEALSLAEQAVGRASRSPDHLVLLADAAWRAGQLARAMEILEIGLRLQPDHGQALAGLARNHWIHGRTAEGLAASSRAVILASDDPQVWLIHAALLARVRRFGAAEAALQRVPALIQRSGFDSATALRRAQESLAAVHAAMRAPEPIVEQEGRSVTRFELVNGVPVVKGRLRSSTGAELRVPLLVDTGGSRFLVLDRSLDPLLDLPSHGTIPVHGTRRPTTQAQAASLHEVSVGDWRFGNVPTLFLDLQPPVQEDGKPSYLGILGPVISAGRILALNFRAGRLLLRDPPSDGTAVPEEAPPRGVQVPFLLMGDAKVVVNLHVEGLPVLGLVDTGSSRTWLSQRLARKLFPGDDGASTPASPAVSLRLGNVTRTLDAVGTLPALDRRVSPSMGAEIGVLLGVDYLRNFGRLVLDYQAFQLTLSMPNP